MEDELSSNTKAPVFFIQVFWSKVNFDFGGKNTWYLIMSFDILIFFWLLLIFSSALFLRTFLFCKMSLGYFQSKSLYVFQSSTVFGTLFFWRASSPTFIFSCYHFSFANSISYWQNSPPWLSMDMMSWIILTKQLFIFNIRKWSQGHSQCHVFYFCNLLMAIVLEIGIDMNKTFKQNC